MNTKKAFLLFSILCASLTLTACWEQDKMIGVQQMPQAAQDYLKKNYPTDSVLIVEQDNEFLNTTYKVQLTSGLELEFNADGQVIDMDIND